MPSESEPHADGRNVRQLLLWSVFAVVLVLGVVLYFRYSGGVVPLLDPRTAP